jgi:hypothetical protein
LHLGVGRQQIEALRVAPRRQVQVDVVAHNAAGDDRIVPVLNAELLEGLKGFFVDHGPLLDPADLVLLGLHVEEAAVALDHLERLAVDHLGHPIGDGGDAVVQVHLARAEVDLVVMLVAEAAAAGGKSNKAYQQHCRKECLRAPRERSVRDGCERKHSLWRSL